MDPARESSFATIERLVGSSITIGRGSLAVSRPVRLALGHLDDVVLMQVARAASALAADMVRQAAEVRGDAVFWWALSDARGTRFRYAPRRREVKTVWRPK